MSTCDFGDILCKLKELFEKLDDIENSSAFKKMITKQQIRDWIQDQTLCEELAKYPKSNRIHDLAAEVIIEDRNKEALENLKCFDVCVSLYNVCKDTETVGFVLSCFGDDFWEDYDIDSYVWKECTIETARLIAEKTNKHPTNRDIKFCADDVQTEYGFTCILCENTPKILYRECSECYNPTCPMCMTDGKCQLCVDDI